MSQTRVVGLDARKGSLRRFGADVHNAITANWRTSRTTNDPESTAIGSRPSPQIPLIAKDLGADHEGANVRAPTRVWNSLDKGDFAHYLSPLVPNPCSRTERGTRSIGANLDVVIEKGVLLSA